MDPTSLEQAKAFVPDLVVAMRSERMGMVQTQEQLDYIYTLLDAFYTGEIPRWRALSGGFQERLVQMLSPELREKMLRLCEAFRA